VVIAAVAEHRGHQRSPVVHVVEAAGRPLLA